MALKYFLDEPRTRRVNNRATADHSLGLFNGNFEHWLEDFFDDLGSLFTLESEDSKRAFAPKVDIQERESSFEIVADIPGMNEKDITVSLKDQNLLIKGERKIESENKDKRIHQKERSYGMFERSIQLPENIDADGIMAKYNNGVLCISIPKVNQVEKHSQRIEVQEV